MSTFGLLRIGACQVDQAAVLLKPAALVGETARFIGKVGIVLAGRYWRVGLITDPMGLDVCGWKRRTSNSVWGD